MQERVIDAELYCKKNMVYKYKMESKSKYERFDSLEIQCIENGIVHPISSTRDNFNKTQGGVTDVNLNLIQLSLTKRVSPKNFTLEFEDWYCGCSNNFQLEEADYVDEDVVFLGALSSHYGHFITEGLARLWFFLDSKNLHYKGVYISDSRNNKFIDCFRFFGIKDKNFLEITKPTRFRTVIIPEPSIRLHDFYHSKYKQTIDKIKENVVPAQYAKVFFSKAKSASGRGEGELPIQTVFEGNGFAICYPERMSMYETISVLKGCSEFAATSGTNIHNSIFMNDGKSLICLNRSGHFHPLQIMIDRMKNFQATYVDVFLFSTDSNFGDSPCFVSVTSHLRKFFNNRNFCYGSVRYFFMTPYYLVLFMIYLLYKKLNSLYFKMTKSNCKSIRILAGCFRKIKGFVF